MKIDKPALPHGIYGITAERFSCGRSNLEVVRQMIAGGVTTIQYREKRPHKSFAAMLQECCQIREMTRRQGVMFIVNDYVDIALLSDADGVHVGQDDLPVEAVRQLLGDHKVIGLSTHSPAQARRALALGADYIGVGPLFSTQTKADVCAPVGLGYLEDVVENVAIPFVAIGGIKAHNLDQVIRHGARTICLVTEIVGAKDIAGTVRQLSAAMATSLT